VEPAGLRTPIIMLRHITRTSAKQILSPFVIALQVALVGGLNLSPHIAFSLGNWRFVRRGKRGSRIIAAEK
jgi:hypothetical protein